MRTLEDVMEDLGGMGKFQIYLILLVELSELFTGWSMLMMSFAGLVPTFECVLDDQVVSPVDALAINNSSSSSSSSSSSNIVNSTSINTCGVNSTSCSAFSFHDVTTKTVISEWDLVCDRKWAKQVITSVQMAGVLVGATFAGQFSDSFGRKTTLYAFCLYHIVMNVVAAFSVSWIMFAVMRFLIGVGMGAIMVVTFTFEVEFLPIKWRAILSIMPTWALGVAVFALASYLLENWWHLHLALAAMSAPTLLGWFYLPESVRWLCLKGKLHKARHVLEKIATINGGHVPSDANEVLLNILQNELHQQKADKKYTYLDLFKTMSMIRTDVIIWIHWFTLSFVFYGISFGVSSFSGNLYLNIFLLAVLEIPVRLTVFYFNNKYGRRNTTMTFFLLSLLPSLGCLLAHYFLSDDVTRDTVVNVLCLTMKMFLGSAWGCSTVWTSEVYPTVVRNLGYSWASFGARIGGILAPFLINFDSMPGESYFIMSGVLLVCTVSCVFLKETKDVILTNSLRNKIELKIVGGQKEEAETMVKDDPKS